MQNSEIILSGSLFIALIGLFFNAIYLISKLNQNKFFKYIEHFSVCIIFLSYGFLGILIVLFLIGIMAKITMVLLGY